jgi:hypothetical protein
MANDRDSNLEGRFQRQDGQIVESFTYVFYIPVRIPPMQKPWDKREDDAS